MEDENKKMVENALIFISSFVFSVGFFLIYKNASPMTALGVLLIILGHSIHHSLKHYEVGE